MPLADRIAGLSPSYFRSCQNISDPTHCLISAKIRTSPHKTTCIGFALYSGGTMMSTSDAVHQYQAYSSCAGRGRAPLGCSTIALALTLAACAQVPTAPEAPA